MVAVKKRTFLTWTIIGHIRTIIRLTNGHPTQCLYKLLQYILCTVRKSYLHMCIQSCNNFLNCICVCMNDSIRAFLLQMPVLTFLAKRAPGAKFLGAPERPSATPRVLLTTVDVMPKKDVGQSQVFVIPPMSRAQMLLSVVTLETDHRTDREVGWELKRTN